MINPDEVLISDNPEKILLLHRLTAVVGRRGQKTAMATVEACANINMMGVNSLACTTVKLE